MKLVDFVRNRRREKKQTTRHSKQRPAAPSDRLPADRRRVVNQGTAMTAVEYACAVDYLLSQGFDL